MDFSTAINRVLGSEGGYANDPNDPGGETNWGISKRAHPDLDIASLTRDQAVAIYKTELWDRIAPDNLPAFVQFQVLDFAINSGIGTAIRYLQRAVGVADDGVWGPISAQAVTIMPPCDLALRYLAARLDFLTRLHNWPTAGRGWARRIAADLLYEAEDL